MLRRAAVGAACTGLRVARLAGVGCSHADLWADVVAPMQR
jgi:hypothetical protein